MGRREDGHHRRRSLRRAAVILLLLAAVTTAGTFSMAIPVRSEEAIQPGTAIQSGATVRLQAAVNPPEAPAEAQKAFEALKAGHALSSCTEADGKPVAQDASVRNQYAIDLVLHAPTDKERKEGCSMQQLHQVMCFRNISGETWSQICLRDYTEMHLEAARGDGSAYGWDSVFENVTDLRTGKTLSPRRDSKDASVVWIDLEEPLKPGEQMQISLDYRFPILSDVSSGCRATFGYSDNKGWFEDDGSKPVLALGNFYPILAAWLEDGWDTAPNIEEGGECFFSPTADYRLTLAVPSGWTAAISGPEEKVSTKEADLGGCAVWQVREQEVRDIAAVAGDGLAQKEKKLDSEGVTVVATYYREHEKDSDVLLESGAAAVQAFTEAFGQFPYSSIDVTECALFAGGMEYPELVLISDQLFWFYEGYEEGYVKPANSELAIVNAHEVGHNWFYAAVGNDEYREAWLDESFASYSEHVYRKYISDHDLGDRYEWAEGEAETWENSRGHDRYIDLPASELKEYQTTVYPYGCYFLLRLRRCMGDEQFTRMMRGYYSTYMLRVATTEDFLNILQPYIVHNPMARRLCQVFLSTYSGK